MSKSSLHSDENKILVATLIKARESAGLKQAELAERLNKRQQFISRIESGLRRIDLLEFIMIARALRMDPAELLEKVVRRLPRNFEV